MRFIKRWLLLSCLWLFCTPCYSQPLPSDPCYGFYCELGYDPRYTVEMVSDDGSRQLMSTLEFLKNIRLHKPGFGLSSLATLYYQHIKFFGLTIPDEINNAAVPLLIQRTRDYRDRDAVYLLGFHGSAATLVKPELMAMLDSTSEGDILAALSTLPCTEDSKVLEKIRPFLQYPNKSLALTALKSCVRLGDLSLDSARQDLLLRSLVLDNLSFQALEILEMYGSNARPLASSLESLLKKGDVPKSTRFGFEKLLRTLAHSS